MTSPRSKWGFDDWLRQLDSISDATKQNAYQQAQRSSLVAQTERAESTVGSPYSEHLPSSSSTPTFPQMGSLGDLATARTGLTGDQMPTPTAGIGPLAQAQVRPIEVKKPHLIERIFNPNRTYAWDEQNASPARTDVPDNPWMTGVVGGNVGALPYVTPGFTESERSLVTSSMLDTLDVADVFAETVAQGVGGDVPDLFRGVAEGNVEQGIMETINSFKGRPLPAQIGLSILDPLIVVKAPKLMAMTARGGIHATRSGINWTAVHGPDFKWRQALVDFTKNDTHRNIRGKVGPRRILQPLPTIPELTAMHPSVSIIDNMPERLQPLLKPARGVFQSAERLVNPSSGVAHTGSEFSPALFSNDGLKYLQETGLAPQDRLGFIRATQNANVAATNIMAAQTDMMMAFFRRTLTPEIWGSAPDVVGSGVGIVGRAKRAGSQYLHQLRTRGIEESDGLHAYSVTRGISDTGLEHKLDSVPFIGDVMENPDKYVLTAQQREAAEEAADGIQAIKEWAELEGLDIGDSRDIWNIVNYLPRVALNNDNFKLAQDAYRKADSISKSRTRSAMGDSEPALTALKGADGLTPEFREAAEAMILEGAGRDFVYAPMAFSIRAYMQTATRGIALHRNAKVYKVLAEPALDNPLLDDAVETAFNELKNIKSLKGAMETIAKGGLVSKSVWDSLLTRFPDEAAELKQLRDMSKQGIGPAMARASREGFDAGWTSGGGQTGDEVLRQYVKNTGIAPTGPTKPTDGIANFQDIDFDQGRAITELDAKLARMYTAPKTLSNQGISTTQAKAEARQFMQFVYDNDFMSIDDLTALERQIHSSHSRGRVKSAKTLLSSKLADVGLRVNPLHKTLDDFGVTGDEARKIRLALQRSQLSSVKVAQTDAARAFVGKLDIRSADASMKLEDVRRTRTAYKQDTVQRLGVEKVPHVSGPNQYYEREIAAMIESVHGTNAPAILETLSGMAAGARTLKSAVDIGTALVHGLYLLTNDPEKWGKAVIASLQRFTDPKFMDNYILENIDEVNEFVRYGGVFRSSDMMAGLESGGHFAASVVHKIDTVNNDAIRASLKAGPHSLFRMTETFSNSFETFLDVGKMEVWSGLKHTAKTPEDMAQLASFVNKFSGTLPGSILGVSRTQQAAESGLAFYAPGYARAHAALLADVFRGGIRGDLARKAVARLTLGLLSLHVAGAQILGQEPNLDPTKPGEFLSWQIQGHRVGVKNKAVTYGVGALKMFKQGIENPYSLITGTMFDDEDAANNPILRFLRSQVSVPTSLAWDFGSGADFLGNSVPQFEDGVGMLKHGATKLAPFWVEAHIEAQEQQLGFIQKWVMGPGSTFGGASSHPIPAYERRDAARDKVFQAVHLMSFEEYKATFPNKAEQEAKRLAAQPEHVELRDEEENLRKSRLRSVRTAPIQQFKDKMLKIEADTLKAANAAAQRDAGTISSSGSRREFNDTMRTLLIKQATLKQAERERIDPDTAEDLKTYHEKKRQDSPYMMAQHELFSSLSSFVEDAGGEPDEMGVLRADGTADPQALKELLDYVEGTYGEEVMREISVNRFHDRMLVVDSEGNQMQVEPEVRNYYLSRLLLAPVYDLWEDIVPRSVHDQYQVWNDLHADEKKAYMVDNPRVAYQFTGYDKMVSKEKSKILSKDPLLDILHYLAYGNMPYSPEGRKLELERRKRIGKGETPTGLPEKLTE